MTTRGDRRQPILIAGPTGSGKSALALGLAERLGGLLINVDSMQVYAELRIITARPTEAEARRAPHLLYGHVAAQDAYSVARWLADAERALGEAHARQLTPIFVGGTGLYFKALTEGLSPVPTIPDTVRERWRGEARRRDAAELHRQLRERDPVMAERLVAADRQRVTRALEVFDATGQSLAVWQRQSPGPPLVDPALAARLVINPPRAEIHRRTDARFEAMVAAGALDEVRTLMELQLNPELPVMRAIGLRPLMRHCQGDIGLPEAISAGQLETRQYVKRQQTWLLRHNTTWRHLTSNEYCKMIVESMHFIDEHRG